MKRCTRCLYPDTKPDLFFDDEGVCSACRSFDKRAQTDWDARKREFEILLERGKNDSGYDCIVPSSGGKDSHWQALTLIEMGARPLIVTATTCHLTVVGRQNIDNLARYATTIEVTPNCTVRAKLNRIGLKLVGDISWPEHVTIFSIPFRVAKLAGIPLIFYGECPQEAYGGPVGTDENRVMNRRWVQEFGGMNGLRQSDLVGMEGINEEDMREYQLPDDLTGIEAHFMGQYFEWSSRRNAEVAADHGMTCWLPGPANWWEFENLDNAQTAIHDYFMYLKFGYSRLTAQISVDIREGRISRVDALKHVDQRDGLYPEFYMGVSLDEMLDRIGMTRAGFDTVAEQFRNPAISLKAA